MIYSTLCGVSRNSSVQPDDLVIPPALIEPQGAGGVTQGGASRSYPGSQAWGVAARGEGGEAVEGGGVAVSQTLQGEETVIGDGRSFMHQQHLSCMHYVYMPECGGGS